MKNFEYIGDQITHDVTVSEIRLAERTDLVPNEVGFCWGTSDVRCDRLALAILAFEFSSDENVALEMHEPFMNEVLSSFPTQGPLLITSTEIRNWVEAKRYHA